MHQAMRQIYSRLALSAVLPQRRSGGKQLTVLRGKGSPARTSSSTRASRVRVPPTQAIRTGGRCHRQQVRRRSSTKDEDNFFTDQEPSPNEETSEEKEMVELPLTPNTVTEDDLKTMDEILTCGSQSELVEKVKSVQADGRLTQGVLDAFQAAVQRAEDRNENPGVIASLQGIWHFLTGTYQIANPSPALVLVDKIYNAMNTSPNEEAACMAALQLFGSSFTEGSGLTCESFLEEVSEYLARMGASHEQTDAAFEAQKGQLSEEQLQQAEALKVQRAAAKQQLSEIHALAEAYKQGVADGSIPV